MASHTVPLQQFIGRRSGIRSHLTKAICGASLALFSLAGGLPAQANTKADVEYLVGALVALGTKVKVGNCQQPYLYGFYLPKEDQMVICADSLAGKDLGIFWDTLAHETTHKIQACLGGYMMPASHVGSMIRELRAMYPETMRDLELYPSDKMRYELEARWMELQTPATVLRLLHSACRRG